MTKFTGNAFKTCITKAGFKTFPLHCLVLRVFPQRRKEGIAKELRRKILNQASLENLDVRPATESEILARASIQ